MLAHKEGSLFIILIIFLTACNQSTSSIVNIKPTTPSLTSTATVAATSTTSISGYQPLQAISPGIVYPSPNARFFISSSSIPSLVTLFDQQGKALGNYQFPQTGTVFVRWFPNSSGAILWYAFNPPYPNAVLMDTQGHTHQLPFEPTDVEISNDSQWIAITQQNSQNQFTVSLVKRSDLSITQLGLGETLGWAGTSLLIERGTDVYAVSVANAQHMLRNVGWVSEGTTYQSNESPDGQVVFIETQHGESFATSSALLNLPSYFVTVCGSYAVNGMAIPSWISGHILLGFDQQFKLYVVDIISGHTVALSAQFPDFSSVTPGHCILNGNILAFLDASQHFMIANTSTGAHHDFGILPLNLWHIYWFGAQQLLLQGFDGSLAILDISDELG